MQPLAKTTLPAIATAAMLLVPAADALACGCFSPPVPESLEDDSYAINQLSEQIIFEVEDGHVTAHVSIRYEGEPESFAWMVPVPSVPDLDLSPAALFGLIDDATAPIVSIRRESLCPDPAYVCDYHPAPRCPQYEDPYANGGNNGANNGANNGWDGSADSGGSPEENPGGVVVHQRQVVGSYDTIVFGAEEAEGAIQWLIDEGFLVNDTMAPYMQPYLNGGMLFIASKLIAGAGVEEIKPLQMRFEAENPMIPLQLTAVAAEPELAVTAFIYSDAYFSPVDHPVLGVPPGLISEDDTRRSNYPMVLSRLVDQAGGDGFMVEYAGAPLATIPNEDSVCCSDGWDQCGIAFDGQCQCPGTDFDQEDCGGEDAADLVEGIEMLRELRDKHTHLTRLTTRLSPHEMTFDPMFAPAPIEPVGRLVLEGSAKSLASCEEDVVDRGIYESAAEFKSCATTYCGEGVCVATSQGAGCLCNQGFVARGFTDMDGQGSVTCVPATPTVNHGANGLQVPDACREVECGTGRCVSQNGFPACACLGGHAAVAREGETPLCLPLLRSSETPGAEDFTRVLDDVRVCAPEPRNCGEYGWLIENPNVRREGVLCGKSLGKPEDFIVPPAPTCEQWYGDGYGDANPDDPSVDPWDLPDGGSSDDEVGCGSCSTSAPIAPAVPGLATLLLLGVLALRVRRS